MVLCHFKTTSVLFTHNGVSPMNFFDHYETFANDKLNFFTKTEKWDPGMVESDVKNVPYKGLALNRLLIEQEFDQLFAALQEAGAERKEFWLYCYYCCLLMESYYTTYAKPDKIALYQKHSLELKTKLESGDFPQDAALPLKGLKKLTTDLGELVYTPKHVDKIVDWAVFLNIHRLHWVFCRLTLRQSLLLAQELQWLARLEQFIGLHFNVDRLVANINSPTQIFNYLSVGLFLTRFLINASLIVKHTFFPSDNEGEELTRSERFRLEVHGRHLTMLNDFVWMGVNAISNLGLLLKLSGSSAMWLTASFLIFDVSLLVYRRNLAHQEYLLKKAQYLYEQGKLSSNNLPYYLKHNNMLDDQLVQLEIERSKKDASFVFNIAAAALLLGSFSGSLLLATPISAVFCYCACTIGVAMYLSADEYGKYAEKSFVLEQRELYGKDTTKAQKEQRKARNDFFIVMGKNTVMPFVFVSVFAFSLPAALLLVTLYAAYQNNYFSSEDKTLLPSSPCSS